MHLFPSPWCYTFFPPSAVSNYSIKQWETQTCNKKKKSVPSTVSTWSNMSIFPFTTYQAINRIIIQQNTEKCFKWAMSQMPHLFFCSYSLHLRHPCCRIKDIQEMQQFRQEGIQQIKLNSAQTQPIRKNSKHYVTAFEDPYMLFKTKKRNQVQAKGKKLCLKPLYYQ